MPARIGKAEFDSEVLGSEIPVLADFYSDSCVPCKRLSPVLSKLETEYEGRLKIVKINSNFEQELVDKYDIQAAPTLVFFKNGKEAERIRGAVKKEDITALIVKIL